MFNPPPPADDDKTRISENPLPPPRPHGAAPDPQTLDESVPQGDQLYQYVLDCLERGSSHVEVRKQLIAFGYSAAESEQVVADVVEWRRQNPGALANAQYPA